MELSISKLIRAGLTTTQAELYYFIYQNPGISISEACLGLQPSKSAIYRAFADLKDQGLLNFSEANWKQSLQINSFENLIRSLENRKRRDASLIKYFRNIEAGRSFNIREGHDYIEVLNEQETFEKYMDLSEMKWDNMLAFGNWEDLNNAKRNLIPLEKRFVQNRVKNGGRAFVAVTKDGDYTSEIIDYKNLDTKEHRKSTLSKLPIYKPFWLNVFEGNNYVHLWDLDKQGHITSTFINSASVAKFYRDLVRANMI